MQAEEGDVGDFRQRRIGGQRIGAEEIFRLKRAALPDQANFQFARQPRQLRFPEIFFHRIGLDEGEKCWRELLGKIIQRGAKNTRQAHDRHVGIKRWQRLVLADHFHHAFNSPDQRQHGILAEDHDLAAALGDARNVPAKKQRVAHALLGVEQKCACR